jgi:hypothetical protein
LLIAADGPSFFLDQDSEKESISLPNDDANVMMGMMNQG